MSGRCFAGDDSRPMILGCRSHLVSQGVLARDFFLNWICPDENPLWQRACSRMRCISQQFKRLTLPIRERARSHRGKVFQMRTISYGKRMRSRITRGSIGAMPIAGSPLSWLA